MYSTVHPLEEILYIQLREYYSSVKLIIFKNFLVTHENSPNIRLMIKTTNKNFVKVT